MRLCPNLRELLLLPAPQSTSRRTARRDVLERDVRPAVLALEAREAAMTLLLSNPATLPALACRNVDELIPLHQSAGTGDARCVKSFAAPRRRQALGALRVTKASANVELSVAP